MGLKIGIAADHAGKELKQLIFEFLRLTEHKIVDYGVAVDSRQSVDFPDYASLLAADISQNRLDLGVAICGTGIGMAITANKYPGVRAVSVWDEFTARMTRAHNNANVLCLGARVINHHRAVEYTKIWLETEFEGGRHAERVQKIFEIEKKNMRI